MQEKIQKYNIWYMLAYIFVPMMVCMLGFVICYFCFRNGGTGAVITTMVPSLLAIIWWCAGGSFIFKRHTKAFEQKFTDEGYHRNQTFYGRGKTVVLDVEKGVVGLVFFWNPFQSYIIPASRIKDAWVDDGKSGAGIMEGSGQVSFLFVIDGIKTRVNTFTSNQRFRMDDRRIQTGITKAEHMVRALEEAKINSEKTSHQAPAKPAKSTKEAAQPSDKTAQPSAKSTKPAKSAEKSSQKK